MRHQPRRHRMPNFGTLRGEKARQAFYYALRHIPRFLEAAARYLDKELLSCLLLGYLENHRPLVVRILRDLDKPDAREVLMSMIISDDTRDQLAGEVGVTLSTAPVVLPPYKITDYTKVEPSKYVGVTTP